MGGQTRKFCFQHEASYSPFFLFPLGAGPDFQFWESNFGGELFNQYGRMERNRYVDIIESGPSVWLRWTYFDTDMKGDPPVVRGTDDFVSYPNGIIWRRQTYRSFYPERDDAQCASPLDFFPRFRWECLTGRCCPRIRNTETFKWRPFSMPIPTSNTTSIGTSRTSRGAFLRAADGRGMVPGHRAFTG